MSLKKPIVQYTLKEGMYSAGGASLYAKNTDTKDFAVKIMILMDDEKKRKNMGNLGYKRVVNKLSWGIQELNLIQQYKKIFTYY